MIAARSAAAYPTSSKTSTAASRIFRRVACDRTCRAIAPPEFRYGLRLTDPWCAEVPNPAPSPGLEPELSEPKSDVLPITPRRTTHQRQAGLLTGHAHQCL